MGKWRFKFTAANILHESLFGALSSPGCANYGLKHLAREGKHLYPLASQFILRGLYVDDGVSRVENVEKVIQLAQEAHQLCALGGLRLHMFLMTRQF